MAPSVNIAIFHSLFGVWACVSNQPVADGDVGDAELMAYTGECQRISLDEIL